MPCSNQNAENICDVFGLPKIYITNHTRALIKTNFKKALN